MKIRKNVVLWLMIPAIVLAAPVTASRAAKAWQGLQLESSIPIDTGQARSEATLEMSASAFVFHPVIVTVTDKPKKEAKAVALKFKAKNLADDDYFVYATAVLVDADGRSIVSKTKKQKLDDHDSGKFTIRFRLPYADAERATRCDLRFAFEKE